MSDASPKATQAVKPLLNKNTDRKDRNEDSFHCRSVVGSLSHLAGCTRPDVPMTAHQVAKFSNEPKECHYIAVKRIGNYLLSSIDKGFMRRPDIRRGLEVDADASSAGLFDKSNA